MGMVEIVVQMGMIGVDAGSGMGTDIGLGEGVGVDVDLGAGIDIGSVGSII